MHHASPVSQAITAAPSPSHPEQLRRQTRWAREVITYRDDPQNHGQWPPQAHHTVYHLHQAARNGTLDTAVRTLLRNAGYTGRLG